MGTKGERQMGNVKLLETKTKDNLNEVKGRNDDDGGVGVNILITNKNNDNDDFFLSFS